MTAPTEIPVFNPERSTVETTSDVNPLAREVYEHNQKSVVKVEITAPNGSGFHGSGVLVKQGDDVVIVTNAHVSANARNITFTNEAGETFNASLEKFDDINDLAVLKPDGIKIDPSRAMELGDPAKLKQGDLLYALGSPDGYARPVLSQGTFQTTDTYAKSDPGMADLVTEAIAGYYKGEKGYVQDGQAFSNSLRINSDVPTDHGGSGGALVTGNDKLMGLVETAPNNQTGKTLSVPSDKIQALLDDPIYKFHFNYSRQRVAADSPGPLEAKALGLTALAVSQTSRKIAAPLIGLYYGGQALDDMRLLSHDDLYQSRAHYWEKLAADGGAFAAGIITLVPRFRTVGACLVAARLAVDAVTDWTQTAPVLDSVQRNDGRKGEPLFWTASHR